MGCGSSKGGPEDLSKKPVVLVVDTAGVEVDDENPPPFRKRKRGSVLGESYIPAQYEAKHQTFTERGEKKNDADDRFIRQALTYNFLFSSLSDATMEEVVCAMIEKSFSKGTTIIEKGDLNADFYYILKSGLVHIFVGDKHVQTIEKGQCFGELALMYNAPRAATCIAMEDCVTFALDRFTFRNTLVDSSYRKRNLYESFLRNIPLLHSLDIAEIHRIADALKPGTADDGAVVISQGEPGEAFYIIEKGTASVKQKKGNRTVEINKLKRGDYFGEQALINDEPRVASVIATSRLEYIMMDKAAFVRLLGPCEELLRRNMQLYRKYEEVLRMGLNLGSSGHIDDSAVGRTPRAAARKAVRDESPASPIARKTTPARDESPVPRSKTESLRSQSRDDSPAPRKGDELNEKSLRPSKRSMDALPQARDSDLESEGPSRGKKAKPAKR